MGINFPTAPAIGTLHPNPAVSGVPQYVWDGEKWISGTGGGAIYISVDPPQAPVGSLWWESDTGILYVRYYDGSSTQWVAIAGSPTDVVRYGSAQTLTEPQRTQARLNIGIQQTTPLAALTDFNTIITPGTYFTVDASCTNVPANPGSDYWYLEVEIYAPVGQGSVLQRAVALVGDTSWFRTMMGGAWRPWQKLITTAVVRGYLSGLGLSTPGASYNFTVAAGVAANSTNVDNMTLAASISKSIAALWTANDGGGALDTGATTANTWYHVHLIKNVTTGAVDALASLSATAPTMPAGYTLRRRIGSMKTNASMQWTQFTQSGDLFVWDAPVGDVNGVVLVTTSTLFPLTVPPGLSVLAQLNSYFSGAVATSNCVITSPLVPVQASNVPPGNISLIIPTANGHSAGAFSVLTDTNRNIRAVSSAVSGTSFYVTTTGWIDRRGRDN